ncbi:MAG: hypothetical protein JW821_17430 [Deltaproteobacteria bacterium]|nr:hypothetical protein [Deltaproteobacteria bacterium]
MGRQLIIRRFPFTMGRASSDHFFSSSGPDFLLSEDEAGRISRSHLSIEYQNGQIDLSQEKYLFIAKDISDRVFIDTYFKI